VAQSDTETAWWFLKAAGQGLADAQYNLGLMFSQTRGVPHSGVEAARWLCKAAGQGTRRHSMPFGKCLPFRAAAYSLRQSAG
jgi:TPR repeat protein